MRAAPFVPALVAAVAVACSSGGGGPSDAEVAAEVCPVLVAWTDDTAEIVNATQRRMGDRADLQALVLDALDAVAARTEALADDLAAIEFPDTEGGRALAEDLFAGQRAAAEDIAGFREEIESIPDPDPESTNYRKAQLVVELEKPRSLVKPDVQGDLGDADLEAAIAAEESCRFVTLGQ